MSGVLSDGKYSLTEQFRKIIASQVPIWELRSRLAENDNDKRRYQEEGDRCARALNFPWDLEKIAETITGGNEFKWEAVRGDHRLSQLDNGYEYDSLALQWKRKDFYSFRISLENGLVYFKAEKDCLGRPPLFILRWSEVSDMDLCSAYYMKIEFINGGCVKYSHGDISFEQPQLYFIISEL